MSLPRTIAAVVLGYVAGSAINMGLIGLGGQLVPPPPGVDLGNLDGMRAALPLFEPRHFLFPFLAHALGTFVGALIAVLIAPDRRGTAAWIVGGLFLLGGSIMVFLLPAPWWFNVAYLLLAYLPMAWLAIRLGRSGSA